MLALTIIAIVLSAGALGVSIWAAWSNGRSADAAEDSAVTSRQAAEASKESAEQARRSADAADRVAQAEVSRDHESLAPTLNGKFAFAKSSVSPVRKGLWYEFTLPRHYEVRAETSANQGQSTSTALVTAPKRVDEKWRIFVEEWATEGSYSGERTESALEELTIRFWPAAPSESDPHPWGCACGRPPTAGEGPGHWQWKMPIKPPEPMHPALS
jgi:hypothetical protein